jgi:hypothetical protein
MNSSGHQAPSGGKAAEGGQCAVTTTVPRRTRHTKRDALQRMQALGAPDRSVGACVYRLRCAGITDSGIGRLLGFPDAADPESVRRNLNRREREDGFRTEVDAQARADVRHAEKRVGEACRRMRIPVDADLVHFTLDADLAPCDAAGVLDYLRALVALLEAEVKANLLHLPREGMPGARPVAWSEVRERIASIEACLHEEDRRRIVAAHIADCRRREQWLAALREHDAEEEILRALTGDPDAPALSTDALGHLPISIDAVMAVYDPEEDAPRRRRRRIWPDRQHIHHERSDARLILEQRVGVGDLRIAAR